MEKVTIGIKEEGKGKDGIYFPELDGLRFFAFLLVFMRHFYGLFSEIPCLSALHTNGWIGVDLFLALSSFLFTKLLMAEYGKNKKIDFAKFYLRRIFRIWPVYLAFVGFSVALYLLKSKGALPDDIGIRIVGLLSFTDNIVSAFRGFNPLPYVLHLWTISYEEQFYLFVPFVILLLARSSRRTRIIAAISVFVLFSGIRCAFIAGGVPHPAIWVLPITHFESICLGIIIGFGGFDFLLRKIKPPVLGLIGVLFFVLLGFLPPGEHISYWLIATYSFAGISTSLMLFSVMNGVRLKKFFSNGILVFLGKRSYGLYLFHLLGNAAAAKIASHLPSLLSSPLARFLYSLSFTIIASIVSYKVIETPFLKLKKKFEVVVSRPV